MSACVDSASTHLAAAVVVVIVVTTAAALVVADCGRCIVCIGPALSDKRAGADVSALEESALSIARISSCIRLVCLHVIGSRHTRERRSVTSEHGTHLFGALHDL
jgi:hypothetical protein